LNPSALTYHNPVGKITKKIKECVFVNSVLKIQCRVKNTLLQAAFSIFSESESIDKISFKIIFQIIKSAADKGHTYKWMCHDIIISFLEKKEVQILCL